MKRVLVVAAIAFGVSCLDMSSPSATVSSISTIRLPSPSVALGDTMRDSAGAVTPLRVAALNANGDTIQGATLTFFLLDRGAHVSASGLVIGDSLTTVRVVASTGTLQTPPVSIPVTTAPAKVTGTAVTDTLCTTLGTTDSTKNQS